MSPVQLGLGGADVDNLNVDDVGMAGVVDEQAGDQGHEGFASQEEDLVAGPLTSPRNGPPFMVWVPLVAILVLVVGAAVVLGIFVATQSRQLSDLRDETSALQIELGESQASLNESRTENATMSAQLSQVDEREALIDQQSMDLAERESAIADLEASVIEREKAVGLAEEAAAKNSFGSGVHLVNVDIAPGTYRNEGTKSCYWARLSGTSGEFGDLITNGLPDGPTVVTISPTDVAFESSNCGTWTLVQ